MKIILLIFLLILTGCQRPSGTSSSSSSNDDNTDGQDDPTNYPSYPFNFDAETPDGIMIETKQLNHPPLEDIDTWYAEVQQCVADWYAVLYPSRTFDFVLSSPVVLDNNTSLSVYCGNGGTTGVYCTNYQIPFIALDAGSAQFAYQWKHEFIHHILYSNDFSNQMNFNHQPSQIWDCQYN